MIMVEVYMPAIDEQFDFMLDENADLDIVILEMTEMIARKTKSRIKADKEDFVLYFVDRKAPLSYEKSLYESGVRDGDRLMLV